MHKIGFIGLGLMGSAIVSRLLDLGYPMTVMGRRNRTPIELAIKRGASEATSGEGIARQSEVVFLCVDNSASVESIMLGSDGVIAGIHPGTVVIDLGTSQPDSTKQIAQLVANAGGSYLDAPLGRTPAHAKEGLLNIMAAGDKSAFDRVYPVLSDIGENIYYLGASGCGHTAKLINNFFGMTLATAMSEAFAVADKAGVKREDLYSIMSSGPLHSAMMDLVKANAVDGDSTKLAFSIANAAKDLGYYTQMTDSLNSPTFIGSATKQALNLAATRGYGSSDVPVMVNFFEEIYSNSKTN